MTSNQLYGAMNRRFDRRLAKLRSLGFVYRQGKEQGVAVVSRLVHGREQVIPAATILIANNRLYEEMVLRRFLRR